MITPRNIGPHDGWTHAEVWYWSFEEQPKQWRFLVTLHSRLALEAELNMIEHFKPRHGPIAVAYKNSRRVLLYRCSKCTFKTREIDEAVAHQTRTTHQMNLEAKPHV